MNVLFWSGGKDSYLTLRYHKETDSGDICLLTTYNAETEEVPFQSIGLQTIKEQASALSLPHHGVALPPKASNDVYINRVCNKLDLIEVENLVFGDWHLRDIRNWREQQFEEIGYNCTFPIWEKPLGELVEVLEKSEVRFTISAVDEDYREYVKVGQEFNRAFVDNLPSHIDPMGEKGEFHTRAELNQYSK